MLLLTGTADAIQVINSATIPLDVHASWVDNASGTITPGRTNTAISASGTVAVVSGPAAATQRNVQTLVIRNKAASTAADVTVQHFDGAITAEMFKVPLSAGCEVQYLDSVGWGVFNTSGEFKTIGTQGPTGPTGAQGPQPTTLFPLEEEVIDIPMYGGVPSGYVRRENLAPGAKGWSFLGTATGTGVTIGPVIWTGEYRQLMFEYVITGYNGGTPVGRILIGAASITTTGATNSNRLIENITLNAVASLSVPGTPLATTLSNIARSGHGRVLGASGSFKQLYIQGNNGNPSVSVVPVHFLGTSQFSDLSTNLLIQRMQMTVYDTISAVAVSAQTFSSGSYFSVWGRNQD